MSKLIRFFIDGIIILTLLLGNTHTIAFASLYVDFILLNCSQAHIRTEYTFKQ